MQTTTWDAKAPDLRTNGVHYFLERLTDEGEVTKKTHKNC